jgi:hypothetical protein
MGGNAGIHAAAHCQNYACHLEDTPIAAAVNCLMNYYQQMMFRLSSGIVRGYDSRFPFFDPTGLDPCI